MTEGKLGVPKQEGMLRGEIGQKRNGFPKSERTNLPNPVNYLRFGKTQPVLPQNTQGSSERKWGKT